jgi:cytochrome c-type biogenesis protein CcmH
MAATSSAEMLQDPALEARAREIGKELRCLVCQNQSIDDSDADLARDLRRLVRDRLVAGDSNEQVLAYVTDRYGDFVLLKPPVKPATWLLWFGPPLVLAAGGVLLIGYFRGRGQVAGATPELDRAESERLRRLLGEDTSSGPA